MVTELCTTINTILWRDCLFKSPKIALIRLESPYIALRRLKLLKVPLAPQIFLFLKKSTSFPDFISEKIISIDKILALLQAFEHVISMFTTAQRGIWVRLLVTSLRNRAETLKRLLTELRALSNIFGLFVIHLLSKPNKIFT